MRMIFSLETLRSTLTRPEVLEKLLENQVMAICHFAS